MSATAPPGEFPESFIELPARERARAILDPGSFRELLGPFERMHSPWLELQGIVPQEDDGVIIARGLIGEAPSVVIATEGAFQAGSIGEVGGAKIATALELALRDSLQGRPVRPVLLLETGGVRLQEATLGLAAVARIHSAILAMRGRVPVIGVVSGLIGCFGGMSVAAALCSTLIVTRQARLGLSGPEVIEHEAGVEEFDSADRALVWSVMGGEARVRAGLADVLAPDDRSVIAREVREALRQEPRPVHRSEQIEMYGHRLDAFESSVHRPAMARELRPSPGRIWFDALTASGSSGLGGSAAVDSGAPASVLCADAPLGGEAARFLAVVPDPDSPFPRARRGEIGLREAWALAAQVRDAVQVDARGSGRRPLVTIVDTAGQAYGRLEEQLGIHLALAAAVDAYATARLAGHPVIALLVGPAIAGAFLAHGLQSNLLLALDDPSVEVHVMGTAAALVLRRSTTELEVLREAAAPMARDIRSFASLGSIDRLIAGVDARAPTQRDVKRVAFELHDAVARARSGPLDAIWGPIHASTTRLPPATLDVRRRLTLEWDSMKP
jgi:malonate decarboxylase beta subunit